MPGWCLLVAVRFYLFSFRLRRVACVMNSPPSAECRVATPEETAGCAVGTNSDLSQSQEPVRNGSSNSNDSGSSSSSESLSETKVNPMINGEKEGRRPQSHHHNRKF